jgi:AP-4 complex subunit epsilon-1
VLLLAGDLVPDSVAHNLMRLVAEGAGDDDDAADHELRTSAVEAYLQLLSTPQLPPVLMKIVYWVLGEYGLLAPQQSAQSLVATLVAATERHANDGAAAAHLKGFALTAITKVCAHARLSALPEAAEPLARAAETSQCVDLQVRL